MADNNGTITQSLSIITQSASGIANDTMVGYGPAVQTLPSITQSGTASYPLQELLTSGVNAAAAPFEFATEELTSLPVTTSEVSTIVPHSIADTVSTSSIPTYDVNIDLTSTVQVSEGYSAEEHTWLDPITLPRPYKKEHHASDAIFEFVTIPLSSRANVSSSFTMDVATPLLVSSVNASADVVTPGVTYNHSAESVVNVTSEFYEPSLSEAITDAADITTTFTPHAVVTNTLVSTATVTTTIPDYSAALELLTSTVTTSHSFAFGGDTFTDTLVSVANVSDWLWARDFGAVAWVMNTQSGGLTNYDNFGFTSLAFHSGKLYGTSPNGLFELGADNDDGRQIDSVAKGGFLDFGGEEKKRMSDIYVGYTGGELECDVETYDGPEDVYTYSMEYRDADAPRNNRLKVGRGLASRYWRFAFRNVGGADFQIHDIAVEIARSQRRL